MVPVAEMEMLGVWPRCPRCPAAAAGFHGGDSWIGGGPKSLRVLLFELDDPAPAPAPSINAPPAALNDDESESSGVYVCAAYELYEGRTDASVVWLASVEKDASDSSSASDLRESLAILAGGWAEAKTKSEMFS